ncbi:sensor histidine kinase [Actinoplanes utahensis]|nr:histidine kinase [Actinoplanes utahensis]
MDEQRERRWNRAWALAPYGLLALACLVFLVSGRADALTLVVAGGLAVLHWWFIVAHPGWWERRSWWNAGYFAAVLTLTAVLLHRDAAFQIFVPACYLIAFLALPGWWAYPGVFAANLPTLAVTGPDAGSLLISFGVATPLAALFGGMVRTMEREAIRRREVNSELVAMTVENARLAREAGVAGERARLAREIHDTVAQGLTGIVTQLEALETTPSDSDRRRLDTARALARTSLQEVRRSIDALRPGPLRDVRLGEAIGHTVQTWSDQYGVSATFTVTGTPSPLHSACEVTLLRAAQEALSNVGRHASAGRVHVTLSYMEDVIALDVHDDGIGFSPADARGFGLTALRQRAGALAGSVEIESRPGAGTTVSVTVPLIEARR